MEKKIVVNRALQQKASGLDGMAQHIKSTATWADLGLPTEVVSQLRKVCSQVKQRDRVPNRESKPDKRLIILFSGLNGIRNTKAAEVIANELGVDLYRCDLSAIVSKYIGETEKNLSRVFDGAEAADAILFFDEADALFGKRNEVKDAHDRYANIEVSYLLRRIEGYNGIAILTTNLHSDLDEAFLRRLDFIVALTPPNADEREGLWRDVLPIADVMPELPRKSPPRKT